jgi:C1A family cysteine protease
MADSSSLRFRDKRWYGMIRDTRDPRDHKFMAPHIPLPPSVDLEQFCPPVMNQRELGACTAHAITGVLRYLLIKTGKKDVPLSRLQLYYDERRIEGTVNEDSGAEIRDGIKSAQKLGVGDEALWPYDIARFKEKPPSHVYTSGLDYQGLTYERVNVGTVAVKTALAMGFPVVIGVTLFDSFESKETEKTGMVPMPDLKHEGMVGGHCMYVIGYGQKAGHFKVRNSWDTDWGDKGNCYMPENYIGSPDFGGDYWIIKSIG